MLKFFGQQNPFEVAARSQTKLVVELPKGHFSAWGHFLSKQFKCAGSMHDLFNPVSLCNR